MKTSDGAGLGLEICPGQPWRAGRKLRPFFR